MKEPKKAVLKIAILCTDIPDIGAGTATAALAYIIIAMPQVDPSLVQMIVTIPSLFLMIFSPIYAKSTQYINRKTLLNIGFVLYCIGGVGPAFANNIYAILFMRCLLGIAAAIMMSITADLIVSFFDGGEKRTMLGFSTAVSSIGGIIFQSAGGYLATFDWHYCFYANLFAIPFFVFSMIFLPEPSKLLASAEGPRPAAGGQPKGRITPKGWCMLGFATLWEVMLFVFLTCASIVIVGEGIATSASAGITVSLFTVGGLIISATYGKLNNVFKKYNLPVAYAVTAVGFLIFYLAEGPLAFHIAGLVIGFGYGIATPASLFTLSEVVTPEAKTMGVSLFYCAKGIGGFFNPFIFALIYRLTDTSVGRFTFQVAIYCLLVLTVLIWFYVRWVFKKKPSAEAGPSQENGEMTANV